MILQKVLAAKGLPRTSNAKREMTKSVSDHAATGTDEPMTHVPVRTLDTFFDMTFYFRGIQRLHADSTPTVFTILAANYSKYYQSIIFISESQCDGAKETIAITSIEITFTDVAGKDFAL